MKIKVIGSGFSGLTIAYFLLKKGHEVEIHEKSERVGGVIQTKIINGNIIESAANGFVATEKVVDLLEDLNLIIISTHKNSKKRYIYNKGRPSRWPFSIIGTLKLFRGILRVIFRKQKYKPLPNQTVESWSLNIFGEEFTYNALGPGLNGVYAGNISRMSSSLLFGKFFLKSLRQKKSKKYKGTISAEYGMGEVIDALKVKIINLGAKFIFNSECSFDKESTVPTVLATDLNSAKDFFKNNIDSTFKELETLNLCSTTVHYKSEHPIQGFGILFPQDSNIEALGVLMNRNIFPNRCESGHTETWILGGEKNSNINDLTDEKILSMILSNRKKLFSLSEKPNEYVINRSKNAIPHYTIELESFLNNKNLNRENLFVTGNYLGQIGLSGILENNYKLADKINKRYENA